LYIDVHFARRKTAWPTEKLILALGVFANRQHHPRKREQTVQILTTEGKRNINDALILRTDRPRIVAEHVLITVYLLTGERVTGVVDVAERPEFTESVK
jgi:hypothetical protein